MEHRFEEILDKYGTLTYTSRGNSMYPMLREKRDVFTIRKKTNQRFKENDVVLFKRNGDYILHRIVKVFDDHYTILGDNCISYEENIKDEDILGVLVSFRRNGKNVDTDNLLYQIYEFFIRLFEKPRIIRKKAVILTKRFIRRLFVKNQCF